MLSLFKKLIIFVEQQQYKEEEPISQTMSSVLFFSICIRERSFLETSNLRSFYGAFTLLFQFLTAYQTGIYTNKPFGLQEIH